MVPLAAVLEADHVQQRLRGASYGAPLVRSRPARHPRGSGGASPNENRARPDIHGGPGARAPTRTGRGQTSTGVRGASPAANENRARPDIHGGPGARAPTRTGRGQTSTGVRGREPQREQGAARHQRGSGGASPNENRARPDINGGPGARAPTRTGRGQTSTGVRGREPQREQGAARHRRGSGGASPNENRARPDINGGPGARAPGCHPLRGGGRLGGLRRGRGLLELLDP